VAYEEGFPVISRLLTEITSGPGNSLLPDKEFRYLRTVHRCYFPKLQGGWLISGRLSRSPVRSDYLISPSTSSQRGRRIVSEDSRRRIASEFARYRFDSEPFLLIVRTRHVVTIVNDRSDVTMSSAGYSEIPAYSRLLQLPWSIVTAAVYRGLDSKLRPKANLSS